MPVLRDYDWERKRILQDTDRNRKQKQFWLDEIYFHDKCYEFHVICMSFITIFSCILFFTKWVIIHDCVNMVVCMNYGSFYRIFFGTSWSFRLTIVAA